MMQFISRIWKVPSIRLAIRCIGMQSYHNILLSTKYQVDFDRLLQSHMLEMTEENKYLYWKFCKVLNYCKEKVDDKRSNHKRLVE
jgi:hypothetical protein